MLPEAKHGDLLYVTNGCSGVCVFTYPAGKLVGSLDVFAGGLCSDALGNVFVTVDDGSNGAIWEYAHGGTSPIAMLDDSPNYPSGCSVDPTTENLAVANLFGTGWGYDRGNVAIYQNGSGTAALYHEPNIYWYYFCSYDDRGNLLVDGRSESGPPDEFAEFPTGGSQLNYISIDDKIGFPGPVQWDGKYFAIGMQGSREAVIDRVSLSGSTGTVVKKTRFEGPRYRKSVYYQFAIKNGMIVVPYSTNAKRYGDNRLGIWRYPSGGEATRVIKGYDGNATVSLAPK